MVKIDEAFEAGEAPIKESARSGAGAPSEPPPPPSQGEILSSTEGYELRWSTRIPLVRNTLLIRQLSMALGGGFLFVLILGIILVPEDWILVITGMGPVLLSLFVAIMGLSFIVMFALERAMKGGIDAEFIINEKGIEYEAGESSKTLNRAGLLGAVLLRSPVVAGGSLISISRESQSIRWKDIKSVTTYKGQHSILIRGKELALPIGVFCTQDNFTTALDLIKKYAPGVKIVEKRSFQP